MTGSLTTMRESSGRVAQVLDGDEFYAKGEILASFTKDRDEC